MLRCRSSRGREGRLPNKDEARRDENRGLRRIGAEAMDGDESARRRRLCRGGEAVRSLSSSSVQEER